MAWALGDRQGQRELAARAGATCVWLLSLTALGGCCAKEFSHEGYRAYRLGILRVSRLLLSARATTLSRLWSSWFRFEPSADRSGLWVTWKERDGATYVALIRAGAVQCFTADTKGVILYDNLCQPLLRSVGDPFQLTRSSASCRLPQETNLVRYDEAGRYAVFTLKSDDHPQVLRLSDCSRLRIPTDEVRATFKVFANGQHVLICESVNARFVNMNTGEVPDRLTFRYWWLTDAPDGLSFARTGEVVLPSSEYVAFLSDVSPDLKVAIFYTRNKTFLCNLAENACSDVTKLVGGGCDDLFFLSDNPLP